MESIDLLKELIGNVGFPIAITIYMLTRFEGKMTQMTDAVVTAVNELKIMSAKKGE